MMICAARITSIAGSAASPCRYVTTLGWLLLEGIPLLADVSSVPGTPYGTVHVFLRTAIRSASHSVPHPGMDRTTESTPPPVATTVSATWYIRSSVARSRRMAAVRPQGPSASAACAGPAAIVVAAAIPAYGSCYAVARWVPAPACQTTRGYVSTRFATRPAREHRPRDATWETVLPPKTISASAARGRSCARSHPISA